MNSSGLKPASLTLCTVSAADGGGMSPVNASAVSGNGAPCPDSGTVSSPDNPSWYFINAGSTQGANVQAANACTHGPANTCYVLTDRGTFDYLASGTDPAGTIPALKIVTRGPQSASAPGGVNALVNYFHVYIINPSKPGETVNLTAAQDFVSLLTSQAFQSTLKTYLPTTDPAGPPFVADASPNLTVSSGLPKNYHAGKPLTVKGTLVNAEPGYPALASQTVNVDEIVGGVPLTVASGKTNSTGAYSIKFTPTSSGQYQVSTPQLSVVENATLNPVYGDILSPASTSSVKVTVHGATSNLRVQSQGGKALVVGTVAPGNGHVKGTVTVFARAVGKKGAFKKVATDRLATSQGNFAISAPLGAGAWDVKVKFQDPKQGVVAATSRTARVTIGPKPASSISLHSVKGTRGGFTLAGNATPAGEPGAKIELLRLNTTPGAPARFSVFGTANLGAGKDKVTFRGAKIKHGTRWVLQLEYIRPGESPSFSGLENGRHTLARDARSTRSDEHRRLANRRPGAIPGRRFALMLACTLAALGCPAAVATADPSSDEVVSATVYSPSGSTQNDSVSLAQLQSNPKCTTYSGTDMNELGRTGFVDVQLAPNSTWALSTILGCLTTPVPVGAVHGVTVDRRPGGSRRTARARCSRHRTWPRRDRPTSTIPRKLLSCRLSVR